MKHSVFGGHTWHGEVLHPNLCNPKKKCCTLTCQPRKTVFPWRLLLKRFIVKLGRRRKSSSTDGKEYSNESGFLNTKAKPSVYHAVVVIFLEFFAWGLLTTPVIEVLRVSLLTMNLRLWTWVYYYLYLHKLRTHLENIHFWSMDSFKASKAFFHFYLHRFLGHWGKFHSVFRLEIESEKIEFKVIIHLALNI